MNINDLGKELRRMYDDGKVRKEQVAMIHIFAIKYADEIIIQDEKQNRVFEQILRYAELNNSYKTELSKGLKLASYVEIKKDI